MAAGKIAGLTLEINGEVTGLNKALGTVNQKSRDLQRELKDVEKLLKLDPGNTELLGQKQKILAESIANTKQKLDTLKTAAEQAYTQLEKGEISEEQFRALQREVISTENKLQSLEDDAAKASGEVDDLGDSAEKSGGKFEKLGGILKGAGAAMGAVAVAAGAAAVKLGTEVVKQFGELEQNLGGSEAVFGEYAASIQRAGEEAYKNLGVSQSEYLATANKMGALFQGSGVEQQKSLELTEAAMQRAADMASVMGIDMQVALDSVAGAAKGNFTMMDNLGIAMNATSIEAYALAKGLDFAWNSATQAEKAEVAMQMFFENTEQYAGNFARESTQTISGSIGLLTAATGSFVAGLGNANADMVNLTQNLVEAFQSVIENIVPVLENIVAAIPPAMGAILSAVGDMLPMLLQTAAELFEQVLTTILSLLPQLIPAAVDALMVIVGALINNLPLLIGAAVQLVTALVSGIGRALPQLIPAAVNAVMTIYQGLVANLPMLLDAALLLILGLAQGIIAALPQLIAAWPPIVTSLVEFIIGAIPLIIDAGIQLLTSIVAALPEIITMISTQIPLMIDGIVAAVLAATPMIISAGVNLLTSLVQNLPQIITGVVRAIPPIVSGLVNAIVGNLPQIVNAGVSLLTSLVKELPQIITAVTAVIPTIVDSLAATIIGNIDTIINSGVQLLVSLVQNLPAIISAVVAAIPQIVNGLVTAIVGSIDIIVAAGVQLLVALVQNLPTIIVEIVKAVPLIVAGIVDALIALVPELASAGGDLLAGIWQGISNGTAWLLGKIQEFCGSVLNGIKSFFGIKSPSTLFRDEVGKNIVLGIDEGIQENEKKVIKTTRELSKHILSEATKWVDDKKFYDEMALQDELAFWLDLKSMSGLMAEEIAAIDKKIYSAKKALRDEEKEARKKSADEELAAQKEFESNLKSRAGALKGYAGIFDEIAERESVSGRDLLKNLRDQVSEFENWQKDIALLTERGVNGALLSELQEAGPKAAAQIAALTKLTDDDLTEYADLFERKVTLAMDQAMSELTDASSDEGEEAGEALAGGLLDSIPAIVDSVSQVVGAVRSAFAQYDPGADYQALISEAAAAGDYVRAAQLEQSRNAKIMGEGLQDSFAQTFDYSDFLTEMQSLPDKIAYATSSPKDFEQEDEKTALLKMVADAVGTTLLAGLEAVGSDIFDAIPKEIIMRLRDRDVAELTWDAFDDEGSRRSRMFGPSRETIINIARSVILPAIPQT